VQVKSWCNPQGSEHAWHWEQRRGRLCKEYARYPRRDVSRILRPAAQIANLRSRYRAASGFGVIASAKKGWREFSTASKQ
jgi:hypothetical protein